MISVMKTIMSFLIGFFFLVSSGAALATLTTEELTRLKTSGLGEDVIRFMIENDYGNVERVVKLKEAGFADETIASVIRNDLKAGVAAKVPTLQAEKVKQAQPAARPVDEPVTLSADEPSAKPVDEAPVAMQTSAKVKIEQYLVLGDPIVKNSQDISNATISLLQGRRLKIEWDEKKLASSMGSFLRRKPFSSPFYWDLDQGDNLHSVSAKDNSFILRTGRLHQGMPTSDKTHYWVLYLTPDSPDLEKRIRELLSK